MKKLFLILPVLGLSFLYGCATPSTAPVVQTGTIPVVQTGTTPVVQTGNETTSVIDCQNDIGCIQTNFLACTPATFTPPFGANSSLNLEVIGKVNDICDYKMTRSLQGMLVSKECKMPMGLINMDRANYLFLSDKDPAQLAVAQAQMQLDNQYCTQF